MKIMPMVLCFFLPAHVILAQEHLEKRPFYYVAHRGASYLAPENTLASIKLAWELGADAAECDVMLTADQQVVLFHDSNTKRLTGQNFEVGESSWEALKSLVVIPRATNYPEYVNETIPLLSDVLGTIPAGRMLVIEIKTGPEILPVLKEVLEQHWTSGRISFIAFDFETICGAKVLFPEVPAYYLSSFRADVNRRFEDVVTQGIDGLDLRHAIINEAMADRCRDAGLDLWCWTVNDPGTALKMKALGVSAVTTDRPSWLKEQVLSQK